MTRRGFTMNRYTMLLGGVVAASGLLGLPVSAATITKYGSMAAAGACQGALPNYEGSIRKRPLAVTNEGTSSAFVTCGATNYSGGAADSVNQVGIVVTNRSSASAAISCTMVDGVIDATLGFANYYPLTTTVASGDFTEIDWDGTYQYAQSVSCNVPPNWEINRMFTNYNDEIGS